MDLRRQSRTWRRIFGFGFLVPYRRRSTGTAGFGGGLRLDRTLPGGGLRVFRFSSFESGDNGSNADRPARGVKDLGQGAILRSVEIERGFLGIDDSDGIVLADRI